MASDLEKVHEAGNQLLTLVKTILDLSAAETDKLEQDLESFGAQLHHAFRTPLNAVISYSEVLLEDARDGGLDSFIPDIQKIDTATQRFLALISDIDNYSNIQAGKMGEESGTLSASSETSSSSRPLGFPDAAGGRCSSFQISAELIPKHLLKCQQWHEGVAR